MAITGATIPVRLKDGDKEVEYRFSPLTDKDIDELENWIKARTIKLARDTLTPDMTPAERQEHLDVAFRQASEVSIMQPKYASTFATISGLIRLCWQSVKREHPEVKEGDLRRLIQNAENVEIINDTFSILNPLADDSNGKPEKKVRRVRKTKNRRSR